MSQNFKYGIGRPRPNIANTNEENINKEEWDFYDYLTHNVMWAAAIIAMGFILFILGAALKTIFENLAYLTPLQFALATSFVSVIVAVFGISFIQYKLAMARRRIQE